MSFSTLGLSPGLCTPLTRLGYKEPTPVQAAAIPIVLTGRDLLARAQTGTGKTAAFGLPMIERLLVHQGHNGHGGDLGRPATSRAPRGLVLVPTRELAVQVHAALVKYGAPARLRAAAIFGGVGMRPQIQALRAGVDIVVATPGRLMDHMQQRQIDLSAVEILVLDEADRMLDMGFVPAIRRIVAVLPRTRQTLLFSATFAPEIVQLSRDFTKEAARVDISGDEAVAPTVTHRVHPVNAAGKNDLLAHVLTLPPAGQALVFCRTKKRSDRVGRHLNGAGIKAAVIHGNKSQNARTKALVDFKAGRVTVLVATDLASRGLDIAGLPLVVNYDLPLVPDDYVHRAGRTGRAGLAGRAVSLVSAEERPLLKGIERLLPGPLESVPVSGFDIIERPAPEVRRADLQVRHGQVRGEQGRRDQARRTPDLKVRPAHRRFDRFRPRGRNRSAVADRLNEVIAALDRRVPRPERDGEAAIAHDARALKAKALDLLQRPNEP